MPDGFALSPGEALPGLAAVEMGLEGLDGEGFVVVISPALPDLEGGIGGLWDGALLDPEVMNFVIL